MDRRDEIASALPEPPPPAPAPRKAAIDAAMRRFDGAPPGPAADRGRSRPGRLSRPQLSLLVSLMLVALIGAPAAWLSLGRHPALVPPPASQAPARPAPAPGGPVEKTAVAEPEARLEAPASPTSPGCEGAACRSEEPRMPRAEPAKRTEAEASLALPPPPPPPPAPQASVARPAAPVFRQEEAKIAGDIAVQAHRAAPSPAAPAAADAMAESGDENVVVTGTRRSRKALGRGDWNACTVNDPSRDLARCRAAIAGSASRPEARAALADGLERAWNGDEEEAVSAFGRAIAAAPGSSFAWLNRGLAYQRLGEFDRALADLDQAVRLGRASARAYYNRSQLLRQRGDTKRADADQHRAVGLDPRYIETAD